MEPTLASSRLPLRVYTYLAHKYTHVGAFGLVSVVEKEIEKPKLKF
jgi:hypothetical protein